MAAAKFVLIGAGSTVFTPGLLADLTRSRVFDDAEVWLVDLDPKAVSIMADLGRRLAKERGSSISVFGTTDRREALPGATFVTTTIAVGGAQGWLSDLEIPRRHGVSQTVGDSVGPGGVFRALRHIPELVAIANDIADLAPDAFLINYSNPLTANVRAVCRETPVRAIGLCHGTKHTRKCLAHDLGLEPNQVSVTFAGLNHLCWLLDIRVGEQDLYPALRRLVAERAVGREQAPPSGEEGVHQVVAAELMDLYGLYPAPGDRHVAEFFLWFLPPPSESELPWGLQPGLDMTHEFIHGKESLWEDLAGQADGSVPIDADLLNSTREGERVVDICTALYTGQGMYELAVNLPNRGLLRGLPDEAVVEVPAYIDGSGVHGIAVPALPTGITNVLAERAAQQELTVSAAVAGDPGLALQALLADALTPSLDAARAMLRESLDHHADDLPTFRRA